MFNDKNTLGNNPVQNSGANLAEQRTNVTIHTLKDDLKGGGSVNVAPPRDLPFQSMPKAAPAGNVFPSPAPSFQAAENPNKMPPESQNQKNTQQNYPNPFLDQENPGKVGDVISIKENGNNGQEYNNAPAESSSPWRKAIILVIIILVILIFGGGGYYFWMTRSSKQSETVAELPAVSQVEKPAVEEPAPTKKYNVDTPNYLLVDVSSANAQTISQLLQNTAQGVITENATVPVEFILRDSNNNPISFSVFITLSGITLPVNVTKNINDQFSLYVYPDGSNARLGLAIALTDAVAARTAMTKEETKLPNELKPLFLGATLPVKEVKFKDGQHNSVATRYFNLSDDTTLSVDYAIVNNQLVISTSKNTQWAILDKIGK